MRNTFFATLAFASLFLVTSCDKDPVSSITSGSYVGTFVTDSADAGIIVLDVESSGKVSGYAMIYEDTIATVSITGNISNNALTASASDGTPIAGSLGNNTITGTAAGGEARFSLKLATGTVTLQKYLGSFTSTSGQSESGTLIVFTAATSMWGLVYSPLSQEGPDHLVGIISGNSVSVRNASDPDTEAASGTLSGTTWSGTYTGDTSSGTWSVTLIP